jgi:hypothetical protein
MADLFLRLWRRLFPELSDAQAKVLASVKFPCC